jgi:hypothetical protein
LLTVKVLYHFKDNFDYTKISQYISGVVNEEILGAKIHAFFMSGMMMSGMMMSGMMMSGMMMMMMMGMVMMMEEKKKAKKLRLQY